MFDYCLLNDSLEENTDNQDIKQHNISDNISKPIIEVSIDDEGSINASPISNNKVKNINNKRNKTESTGFSCIDGVNIYKHHLKEINNNDVNNKNNNYNKLSLNTNLFDKHINLYNIESIRDIEKYKLKLDK